MEVILIIIAVILGAGIVLFNRLVSHRNFVADAWAGIEVQLTKRHDLVPMLVKCVKAYRDHESALLQRVTELRAPQVEAKPSSLASKEEVFGAEFAKLVARAEDYPELKADANFRQLQNELVAVENDLESARRYYNATVRDLNNKVESFPSNLIAQAFKFEQAEFFKLRIPSIATPPKIQL